MSYQHVVMVGLLTLSIQCQYDFNFQVLELPGAVCLFKHCGYLPKVTSSDSLNYHGVWPSNQNGKHPFFCTQDKYNSTTIQKQLLDQLDIYWNGLYAPSDIFRSHEYEKHGTCFYS